MATSVGELWHILAVGLPLDFPQPKPDETGPSSRRGPGTPARSSPSLIPPGRNSPIEDGRSLDAAHAVEIYNHGCAMRPTAATASICSTGSPTRAGG